MNNRIVSVKSIKETIYEMHDSLLSILLFLEIGRFSIRASSRPHLQLKEHLDRENCDSNFIDQNISIK